GSPSNLITGVTSAEYITKKQLFNATSIYLEAIYSLCVEE
ncbi:hypothetical protein, partial [Staphylococcus aureus]